MTYCFTAVLLTGQKGVESSFLYQHMVAGSNMQTFIQRVSHAALT